MPCIEPDFSSIFIVLWSIFLAALACFLVTFAGFWVWAKLPLISRIESEQAMIVFFMVKSLNELCTWLEPSCSRYVQGLNCKIFVFAHFAKNCKA